MSIRRRRRGFERAGTLPVTQLGVSPRRAKELLLATAWSEVAGESIARRTTALTVKRGVLEVRVPDEQWADTLTELIPRLAGRLAAAYPELGVSKFRLRRGDSAVTPRARAIDPEPGSR